MKLRMNGPPGTRAVLVRQEDEAHGGATRRDVEHPILWRVRCVPPAQPNQPKTGTNFDKFLDVEKALKLEMFRIGNQLVKGGLVEFEITKVRIRLACDLQRRIGNSTNLLMSSLCKLDDILMNHDFGQAFRERFCWLETRLLHFPFPYIGPDAGKISVVGIIISNQSHRPKETMTKVCSFISE